MAESIDQLRESFVEETMELINELEAILLSANIDSVDASMIDKIFRIVHTIKGSGGMLGFEKILELTHGLEDHYDKIRGGDKEFTEELLLLSLKSIDILKQLVSKFEELDATNEAKYQQLVHQTKNYGKGQEALTNLVVFADEERTMATFVVEFTPGKQTLDLLSEPVFLIEELKTLGDNYTIARKGRSLWFNQTEGIDKDAEWIVVVSTTEPKHVIDEIFEFTAADSLLAINQVCEGDLLSVDAALIELNALQNKLFDSTFSKLTHLAERHQQALSSDTEEVDESKFLQLTEEFQSSKENMIKSVRVDSDKIDQLMNLVSEMVTLQARLRLVSTNLRDEDLNAVTEKYDSFSKQLRDNAFNISLVPFGVTITRFKRLVHDLSAQLHKELDFRAIGEDTVLDRKIIEQLNDPIMHILRNAIDHGVEPSEVRIAAGKPARGTIEMKIFHRSNNVIIHISDDGKGIDVNKLREVAVRKGVLTADAQITDNEALNLVFLPGFSSAEKVSNVSGRGVGLDVVKKNIQKIRGEIHIETEVGKGSTFVIKLPLTLSIIDGLQVNISDRRFIIPLIQVDKIYTLTDQLVEGELNQMILLEGMQVPYFDLRSDFGITGVLPERREIVLVSYEKEQVALIVDSVVGENQTVLKPLGKHYKNQDFVSGGTIMGDGSVALVLDVNKIVTVFSKK
jgi:two-component system, chemotaxis family, sensor kinase CheA